MKTQKTNKDRATVVDHLSIEGGSTSVTKPRFAFTMPGGRLPTIEEIQTMQGVSRERAEELLAGYR